MTTREGFAAGPCVTSLADRALDGDNGAATLSLPAATTLGLRRAGLARFEVAVVIGGQFVQLLLTFGTSMVIARMVSASGFGVVNLLRTVLALLTTIAPLGLDAALLKYCGKARPGDPLVPATIRRLRLVAALVSLGIVAIGTTAAGVGVINAVYDFAGFETLLVVSLAGLPFAVDLAIMGAVYKASGQAAHYALITFYLQTAVRVVLVAAAVLLSPTVTTIVWINTLQIVISALVLIAHDRRGRRMIGDVAVSAQLAWAEARHVLGEARWMATSLFVYGIMRMVDVLFLGAYADAKSVGEYTALSTIAQLIQFYPLAASQSLGPNVSRLYHAGDIAGVEGEVSGYVRQAAVVAGFLFAGIAVYGDRLDLLFGPSFHFAPLVCILLPLGQVLAATLSPTGYALSMTGHHRLESWILIAGAAFLVVSCAILVPRFGQAGAAGAACLTFLITNVTRFAYVSKTLGHVPGRWADLVPPLVGLGLALSSRWIGDALGTRDLLTTALSCVLYTASFAGVTAVFFVPATTRARVARWLRRA